MQPPYVPAVGYAYAHILIIGNETTTLYAGYHL